MKSVRSLFRHAGQSLGRHLDRLRSTLDELRARLREVVVQAVGQTVGGAVRDTARGVLEGLTDPSREVSSSWSRSPPGWPQHDNLFNEPLDGDRRYQSEQVGWYGHNDLDDDPYPPSKPVPAEEPRPSRWCQALAIGCSAAAWHLRRQVGRASTLAIIGIGLA